MVHPESLPSYLFHMKQIQSIYERFEHWDNNKFKRHAHPGARLRCVRVLHVLPSLHKLHNDTSWKGSQCEKRYFVYPSEQTRGGGGGGWVEHLISHASPVPSEHGSGCFAVWFMSIISRYRHKYMIGIHKPAVVEWTQDPGPISRKGRDWWQRMIWWNLFRMRDDFGVSITAEVLKSYGSLMCESEIKLKLSNKRFNTVLQSKLLQSRSCR